MEEKCLNCGTNINHTNWKVGDFRCKKIMKILDKSEGNS